MSLASALSQDSPSGGSVLDGSLMGDGHFRPSSRVTVPRDWSLPWGPHQAVFSRGRDRARRQRQGTGCDKLPGGGLAAPGSQPETEALLASLPSSRDTRIWCKRQLCSMFPVCPSCSPRLPSRSQSRWALGRKPLGPRLLPPGPAGGVPAM